MRLCLYSVERLNEVAADTGIAFDGLDKGNLYLYRSEQSLEKGIAHTAILREQGVELRVLDRDAVAGVEPALEPVKDRLAGALHAPGDQSGDARMFSRNLAAWCAGAPRGALRVRHPRARNRRRRRPHRAGGDGSGASAWPTRSCSRRGTRRRSWPPRSG